MNQAMSGGHTVLGEPGHVRRDVSLSRGARAEVPVEEAGDAHNARQPRSVNAARARHGLVA